MSIPVILFGAGSALDSYFEAIARKSNARDEYDFIAIADNDKAKWGSEINHIPVISPDTIANYSFSKIIITSSFHQEIKAQLIKEHGIDGAVISVAPKSAISNSKTFRVFEDANVRQSARDLLCHLADSFENHNIPYFLDHGTLLGIYRDGDILPWDDDIDLSIYEDGFLPCIQLLAQSLDAIKQITNCHARVSFQDSRNQTRIIYIQIVDNKRKLLFPVSIKTVAFRDGNAYQSITYAPEHHFRKHTWHTALNRSFRVPHDVEDYLTFHYGDWKTPKKDISYSDVANYIPKADD